jgi:hypothetical protein
VYQFHTRTKTGRSRSLNQAAPDAWVEINATDAAHYGITEGDLVRVESPRGAIEVHARIGQVMAGAVFAPFHYGAWDLDTSDPAAQSRAGQRVNHDRVGSGIEAALLQDRGLPHQQATGRDTALRGAHDRGVGTRPRAARGATHRRRRTDRQRHGADSPLSQRPGAGDRSPRARRDRDARRALMPHLGTYVQLAHRSEQTLADSFRTVAYGHFQQIDIFHTCLLLADMSDGHIRDLAPVARRYATTGGDEVDEPERLHAAGVAQVRTGQIGLLRDLQDLHLLATLVHTTWTVLAQGAQGLRDKELLDVTTRSDSETGRQLSWLTTRMKAAAPQALIIAP